MEEAIAAERQTHSLKLKAMEEKQDMLTKEFEAEYTEIRRKEAQIGRKYEEEKMRADNEATNSRALIEEKQQLLVQVEQLKVKLLEQGNSANSHLQMEQRVREYEQLLTKVVHSCALCTLLHINSKDAISSENVQIFA